MLFHSVFISAFAARLALALPSDVLRRDAAPSLPLSTKGRDIVDANGNVFHYMSSNWFVTSTTLGMDCIDY